MQLELECAEKLYRYFVALGFSTNNSNIYLKQCLGKILDQSSKWSTEQRHELFYKHLMKIGYQWGRVIDGQRDKTQMSKGLDPYLLLDWDEKTILWFNERLDMKIEDSGWIMDMREHELTALAHRAEQRLMRFDGTDRIYAP